MALQKLGSRGAEAPPPFANKMIHSALPYCNHADDISMGGFKKLGVGHDFRGAARKNAKKPRSRRNQEARTQKLENREAEKPSSEAEKPRRQKAKKPKTKKKTLHNYDDCCCCCCC